MTVCTQVVLNMGALQVVHQPTSMTCPGLGSCIGILASDPEAEVHGGVVVMLPSAPTPGAANPERFADTAIAKMIEQMVELGASAEKIRAAIAGGACMFGTLSASPLDLGARNAVAVKQQLRKHGVTVLAEDIGGDHTRSIRYDSPTGQVTITNVIGEKPLCNLRDGGVA